MRLRLPRPAGRPADRAALLVRIARVRAHDAYAEWLAESLAVEHLYARWTDAGRGERRLAFAAYAAALEREERAAEVYAEVVRTATAYLDAA